MGLLDSLGSHLGRVARKAISQPPSQNVEPQSTTSSAMDSKKKPTSLEEYGGFKSEDEMQQAVANYMIQTAEGSADPDDLYQVGLMYYNGEGPYGRGKFKHDEDEGIKWFKKAADRGYAPALNALGMAYDHKKDNRNALRYYQLAAEQDDAGSITNLAMMYNLCVDLKQLPERSHVLFMRAAQKDVPFAQYEVGYDYEFGNGIEKNLQEAVKWYTTSANKGYKHAQYRLGILSEQSENISEALSWYKKAAFQGHEEAQKKVQELS